MAYLIMSRSPSSPHPVFRHAPNVCDVYREGRTAIAAGEKDLRISTQDPDQPEITETHILQSIESRAFYRRAYAEAGLPDPYRGAPL
jgi:hypothetical protein